VASDPLQLEAGQSDRRRIGAQWPEGIDVVGCGECADLRGRPLVVPELNEIKHELAPGVDQHSPVHLAASGDRHHPLCPALDRIQHVADARDRPCPPIGRTLLGPAETWNDLVVLAGPKSDGPSAQIEERGPDASSAYIDCENQIPWSRSYHGGASLQVGVAAKHALMCVRNALRDLEDDGVEKNEAALLEQATAELLRLLDRHKKHRISKRGECAFRRPGEQNHLGAVGFGDPRKVDADWRLARPRDNHEPVAFADRRGGDFPD
jgi:hypothetical protein